MRLAEEFLPAQVILHVAKSNALQGVIALSGVTWPIDGVIVALALVLLVRRTRAGRWHGDLNEHGGGEA